MVHARFAVRVITPHALTHAFTRIMFDQRVYAILTTAHNIVRRCLGHRALSRTHARRACVRGCVCVCKSGAHAPHTHGNSAEHIYDANTHRRGSTKSSLYDFNRIINSLAVPARNTRTHARRRNRADATQHDAQHTHASQTHARTWV